MENVFHANAPLPDGPERKIIDEAYEKLGNVGPGRLVSATHRKDGAWHKNYIPGIRHCIIPNTDILDEYRGLDGAG